MPKAAKAFALGNRMVQRGENFDIPQGQESEFAGLGLIEGEEAAGGEPKIITGPAPLGAVVEGAEPGAAEDADETAERGKRGARK